MVFSLSPAVTVTEKDLSTIVPAVSSTPAAYVGPFVWGPVDEVTLISSENELVSKFGEPDSDTAQSFFSAASFLAYGGNLQVVRVVDQSASNAYAEATALTSSSSAGEALGLQIKNADHYDTVKSAYADAKFAAKYPGELGNSLAIAIIDASASGVDVGNATSIEDEFDALPATSTYATGLGAAGINDEIHIAVIDEDGAWTGTQGTILEKFAFVSKAIDAKKADGSSNYYVDVINNQSQYIWWLGHPGWGGDGVSSSSAGDAGVDWGLTVAAIRDAGNTFAVLDGGEYGASMSGGTNDNVVQADDLNNGWELFADSQTTDISLCITGPAPTTTASYVIDNIAEVRKDCVAFISPLQSDVVDNVGDASAQLTAVQAFADTDLNKSSSYAILDSGWKYTYDRYNDTFRWVPLNGDIAGLCARTDFDKDPWFSPAGYNRGQLKNVTKLAYNPNKAARDELYKRGVNPVVQQPGQGTVLLGDKTLLARPSAFDRINVRRLFIVMEKSIATAANFTLFEFNDEFTRSQFVNQIEPFLRNVQSRSGITDFRVVCDETNNTGDVIDRQEFVADIFVKPNKSINFIQLNFIATRSGIDFNEIGV
jgi:hypothetical protein